MNPIRISAVSYLNTIPFLYGLEHKLSYEQEVQISRDIPSVCAQKLLNKEVDLGLVPVAIIPRLTEAHIISDFCIGAEGKVASVLLLSEVPLQDIQSIYLDYQSRTSVQLCRILCEQYWGINPQFIDAKEGYENSISGSQAAVVIGDRAFKLKDKFPFVYDLSEEWQQWKNLPFVFATWVSNRELPKDFIHDFNIALQYGVERIDDAIQYFQRQELDLNLQSEYLKTYIKYRLDSSKRSAMDSFLKEIQEFNRIL